MSTCAFFVPRTRTEALVLLAATWCLSRHRRMNLFMLCFEVTVSGSESGNLRVVGWS